LSETDRSNLDIRASWFRVRKTPKPGRETAEPPSGPEALPVRSEVAQGAEVDEEPDGVRSVSVRQEAVLRRGDQRRQDMAR
jgi:hypothetical protein